jgi:hypothetical protein
MKGKRNKMQMHKEPSEGEGMTLILLDGAATTASSPLYIKRKERKGKRRSARGRLSTERAAMPWTKEYTE